MADSDEAVSVKIYTYIRTSSDSQLGGGLGLKEQLHQLQLFCEAQGFQIAGQFEDVGVGDAAVDEEDLGVARPGLLNLLAELKDNPVKYLVVCDTSHLWVSNTSKILIQRQLRRYKVDVKAINQSAYSIYRQGQDPSSALVNAILEILESHDRLENRLKLLRGRNRKAAQGGFAGGRAAFGYTDRPGGKVLEVNEEQAVVVRRVFALRSQYPDWTYQAIAAQLNLEEYKTARGRPFGRQHVHAILSKEELYSGIYKYGSITAEGQHPPLI